MHTDSMIVRALRDMLYIGHYYSTTTGCIQSQTSRNSEIEDIPFTHSFNRYIYPDPITGSNNN